MIENSTISHQEVNSHLPVKHFHNENHLTINSLIESHNHNAQVRSLSPAFLTDDRISNSRNSGRKSKIMKKIHEESEKSFMEEDYEQIRSIVSNIKLFKDKISSKKPEDREDFIDEICSIIKFERLKKDNRVFRYGDYGDKFYIILEGTVSVSIPMKVQKETKYEDQDICIRKVLTEVAKLTVGQSFGDMALLDYKPRSATIKCITNCRFAVIPKVDYQKIFGKLQKRLFEKLVTIIKSISYFSSWGNKEVSRLTYFKEEIEYKYGNTVIKQNDPSTHIYIVKDGEFEVLRLVNLKPHIKKKHEIIYSTTENSQANTKMKFQLIKIGQLGIGKIFGEVDAVNNRNYSNTIKCLSSQGTLLRFKSEDFFKILKEVHLQSFTDIENEAKKADYNLPLYLDRNKVVEESSKKINCNKQILAWN